MIDIDIKERGIISERFNELSSFGYEMNSSGYFVPSTMLEFNAISLIENHITAIKPIILQENYNRIVIDFLKRPYLIEYAPEGIEPPESNELFGTLYEATQEYVLDSLPEDDVYIQLYDWAIGLTKCDEVSTYIISPCLESENKPDFKHGFLLWSLGLRKSYWIKNNDSNSGVIYISQNLTRQFNKD